MTPTQTKALEVWDAVRLERGFSPWPFEVVKNDSSFVAICRLIDEHEAFKQAVSNAVGGFARYCTTTNTPFPAELSHFIIPKPDLLKEALEAALWDVSNVELTGEELTMISNTIRKIVEATDD